MELNEQEITSIFKKHHTTRHPVFSLVMDCEDFKRALKEAFFITGKKEMDRGASDRKQTVVSATCTICEGEGRVFFVSCTPPTEKICPDCEGTGFAEDIQEGKC